MGISTRLPAEWEPQSAIMLTWPHDPLHWRGCLGGVERVFCDIARAVSDHQDLLIVCHDERHREYVRDCLASARVQYARAHLHLAPSNDNWARDHGPIGVLNGARPRLLDFRFNGWGGKYPSELDNAITHRLGRSGVFGDTPLQTCEWVLEGGSIDTDGHGTILTTRSCLLSATRNQGQAQAQTEQTLAGFLGLKRFLWLEHSEFAGDDTDGHIDMLARFVNADTIAYVGCDKPEDANYASLQGLATEIQALRQADGRPYRLIELPSPDPVLAQDGGQLPASYANFLITNHKVLVPIYQQATDSLALALLQAHFPQRAVVGIDCLPLIRQYGSLHCVTMQIPAGIRIHD